MMRRRLTLLALVCAVLAATTVPASAQAPTRTYGDARATFQAGPQGGATMVTHNGALGAPTGIHPTGSREDLRIYVLADDGVEYCASGWHLIDLIQFEIASVYPNLRAMFDYLDSIDIRFSLDGTALATERTANNDSAAPPLFSAP